MRQRSDLDTVRLLNGTYIEMNSRDSVYDILPRYFRSDLNTPSYPRESCSHLKKYDRKGLPTNWFELAWYKGRFYTQVVSADDIFMKQINDSVVVTYFNDGPQPARITAFEKPGKHIYRISYSGCWKSADTEQLNIYITDDKTQQAVFEFIDKGGKPEYVMMACEEKIRTFPAIVKASACCRTGPFRSDTTAIPYKQLIADVKRRDGVAK